MQKRFQGGIKEWLLIIAAVLLFLAALIMPLGFAMAEEYSDEEQSLMNAFEKNEIIRLHIIANSDSEQDQAIKLHVRDAVIEAFGETLADSCTQSCEAAFQTLQANAESMRIVAERCARDHGFEGRVSIETGVLHLPAKTYGQMILPEGKYRALRIVLGEGNGQNWWCILYPQLCIALTQTDESTDSGLIWATERILGYWLAAGV